MKSRVVIDARAWVASIISGCALVASAQTPHWIWSGATTAVAETVFLRKTFRTPPLIWNSRLTLAADDSAELFLNGISVATCHGPQDPVRAEVTVRLNQGENVIAIRAVNRSGPAGVLVSLNLGGQTNLVSDESWLASTNEENNWSSLSFNAVHWGRATNVAPHGAGVWGDVLSRGSATPASSLTVRPGFKVELIRSARPDEGSWICLAVDPGGRLVISAQGEERPLLRFEVTNGMVVRSETIAAPVRYAMGLLYAHGSLYANARGPGGAGLYRLTDANANDQFEASEMQLLKRFEGGSEHGYHGLALGPDGKIYVMNGNGTKVPAGLSPRSPYRNYGEDVLSLNADEGPKSSTPAPAGHVLRTDPDGRQWEVWLGGLRNAYDFDFNSDGELFTFDSDMEWDWGTPWYRPTRIVHAVSGGEYGWRDGTRLWPEYYGDSLPGAVDVGIGSPTGVKFGTRSRFPERYRRALFALDWSYGRILAVHLEPDGASYRGKVETFLSGAPLNVTDVEFGADGAMYFITGGRGTQSGLYRVSHPEAGKGAASSWAVSKVAEEARQLRRQLERFHGVQDSAAVALAWPHLSSPDRFIRHAARVALEAQELSLWKYRALSETNATGGLTALLALARVGGVESQPALLKALARFPLDSLDEPHTLLKLRVVQLSFVRHGIDSQMAGLAIEKLDRKYPSASWPVNRELSRLLIRLEAPGVIAKTLSLLESAPSQEEQFHYVSQLRNLRRGWTLPERERYFSWWLKQRNPAAHAGELTKWFADVGRTYVDGAWVDKYLREFRADAIATLSVEERAQLRPLLEQPFARARLLPSSPRSFVREWTLSELAPELERAATGRNFGRGQQAFVDAQCLACHRFGNDGGALGPELTGAGSKYDWRSLLESIVEPSKVINEQYRNTSVMLNDGEMLVGRLVSESADDVVLEVEGVEGRQTIPRAKIESIAPSNTSSMPAGLLNVLSKEEVLDLLAYLRFAGKPDAPAFK